MNYWKKYIVRKRTHTYLGLMGLGLVLVFLGYQVDFSLYKIIRGLPNMLNLIGRMLRINPDYLVEVWPKLFETVEIAIISSLVGIILALPLSILLAKNTGPSSLVYWVFNLIFAFLRTIPALVWAAVLVTVFSIGKFSGIMALSIASVLFGLKMLRDYIESIPANLINSNLAVGASRLQILKYSILPLISQQAMAIFFMILETNIRSATVLGFVGAGGIGQIMWRDLNHLRYDNLATLILVLLVTIFLIDYMSQYFRKRLEKGGPSIEDLADFRLYKRLRLLFICLLILGLAWTIHRSIGIDAKRLALGLDQFKTIVLRMLNMDFSYLPKLLKGLEESFYMALLASLIGSGIGLVLSYFYAYNVRPSASLGFLVKIFVNLLRTFPSVVMAIIFFRGVGPGPLAGVLALAVYTSGVFTKLYGEIVENINPNILDSVRVTGGNNLSVYSYGAMGETRPNLISLILYRLESNMRTSTIMGIIGAGGVGAALTMNIAWRNWERVGLLIFGIGLSVSLIDLISSVIRKKYM